MSTSIYKNATGRAAILCYYNEAVAQLGIPVKDLTVMTRFGATHLLVAGPGEAPPLALEL